MWSIQFSAFDFLDGPSPCFSVGGENVVDALQFPTRHAMQDGFDDRRNAGERQSTREKRGYSNFICGVQGAWQRAALPQRFFGKFQARELPCRNLFEV